MRGAAFTITEKGVYDRGLPFTMAERGNLLNVTVRSRRIDSDTGNGVSNAMQPSAQ